MIRILTPSAQLERPRGYTLLSNLARPISCAPWLQAGSDPPALRGALPPTRAVPVVVILSAAIPLVSPNHASLL